MSKRDKLLARLLARPPDFTWDEAVTLMKSFGFDVLKGAGSRRRFIHRVTNTKVFIHQPHPSNELKQYQLEALIEGLKNAGELT